MPARPLKATHDVAAGDSLWKLAVRYYGLASNWRLIFDANRETIGDDPDALRPGMTLDIPEPPSPEPPGKGDSRVRIDIANLEGRKLLQQPTIMLNGVGEAAAAVLREELKIESIFDLAVSRIFNGVRDLVDASDVIETEYTKHGFVPGDLIVGDPRGISGLDALLRADIEELNFGTGDFERNQATAKRLREALAVRTVRDLALWPPFRAARQILAGTFNPLEVRSDDPEAPADLVPTTGNFATERVYYTSAVLTEVEGEEDDEDLGEAGPLNLMQVQPDAAGFTVPATGALITTEQAWYAQGVTLGQLLHSLTLAPGESTKIAVVDWTRRAYGRSSEDVSQIEQLSQITDQARSISEITNALAQETQHGSSATRSSSTSAEGGVSGGFLFFGGSSGAATNTSVATSVSRTSGTRRLAATTAQNILARTQQHATSARSRRAAIVQETFEEEHEATTTRVVTNYNHMHALSMQYYEVVQVYRVKTRPVRYDRVLFIPMQPFNFNDPRVLARYRHVIAAATPDVERRQEVQAWTPPTSHSKLEPRNAEPIADGRPPAGWQHLNDAAQAVESYPDWIWQQASGGRLERIDYRCADGAEIRAIELLPRYGQRSIRHEIASERAGEGSVQFSYLALDSIKSIAIAYPEEAEKRGKVTVVYHVRFTEPQARDAFLRQYIAPPVAEDPDEGDLIHPIGAVETRVDASRSDLIDHLNENALRYSQAIWMNADSLELSRILSGFRYKGERIVTSLDPAPVAITGNYLGFRWHFADEEQREAWLEENGYVVTESNAFEAMISLPSGGVFAEAVQGRFNAAEKLDLTRFWNWQDSPIPILPPDINPVNMGSRAQPPNLSIDGLDAQAVHITQPSPLPDPTGMQAALQGLTAANIFRDLSGLAHTAGLAQAALQASAAGSSHASEESNKAFQAAMEHQREMSKIALEAAEKIGPLLAGPAGGAGLAASSVSKAGAVMNLAGKMDSGSGSEESKPEAAGGGGGLARSAFQSLLNRFAGH